MPDIVPIRRALISVSDKSGLVAFGPDAGVARRGNPVHRRVGESVA